MVAVVAVIILGLICLSAFLYSKYQDELHKTSADQELIKSIGTVLQLPAEPPVVLAVADKAKLQNRALIGKVENGDQLIVYRESKKIFVYRPSIKKVTDVFVVADGASVTTQGR
jgi:hypothetical protein